MKHFNLDAEQYVLGSCLKEREIIPDIAEILNPFDFYDPRNQELFAVITQLFNDNKPVDLIAVSEELNRVKSLMETVYLATLLNNVHTTATTISHAKLIKKKSLRRQLTQAGKNIIDLVESDECETEEELLSKAESIVNAIGDNQVKGQMQTLKDIIMAGVDAIYERGRSNGITGLSTDIKEIDSWTAGLQKKDLIIVAARPSMGKTAFVLQIGNNIALRGSRVAIFSLEMGKEQLMERILINRAKVDGYKVRIGRFTEEESRRLSIAAGNCCKANLVIDDNSGLTVPEIASKCRRLKSNGGLGLVIIDYLQLMRCHKKCENRQREITEISQALKGMAKELDVPVIAVSQLSRQVEQRQEKRPVMSDLRESGSLEQDADVVMFLYRDEYYNKQSQKKNIAEVIFAKQRNGPVGSAELGFVKEYMRFLSLVEAV